MPQLEEQSIEFAREHITRFYDTDFFPKHFAFEAVWHNWDQVKSQLLRDQVSEIPVSSPRSLTWPKPRGGYRIVHQLDPISALIYTALAHRVSHAIESFREPVESHIACSYRIATSDGSFFESGTGY